MYRDNVEELWKKKEKMRKKNDSRLDFSNKKKGTPVEGSHWSD